MESPTAPAAPDSDGFDAQVSGIAALGDPVRRALYRFVVAQQAPVNREEAAAGVGVAHHVAKFHLDRLVDDGLLAVDYARPPGRGGPGAGRPAKLYRRAARELTVSLPQRDYQLAGRLLAEALTTAQRDETPIGQALQAAAHDLGASLARRARENAGSGPSQSAPLNAVLAVLADCGYEPRGDGKDVTLANCPFHALAQDYTELICGVNLEFLRGVIDGLEINDLDASLEPVAGHCCVRLSQTKTTTTSASR